MGAAGAAGPQGAAGQGYRFRQAWSASTTYAAYDTVTYNGSSYVAIVASVNSAVTPDKDSADWALFVPGGAAGPAGPAGNTGPAGATGTMGPAGAAGPQGTARAGISIPAGLECSITYAAYGTVAYNGSSYVAIVASVNSAVTPDKDSADWALFVPGGAAGPAGPAGNTGPAGATGTMGPAGAAGAAGAAGPQGTARAGISIGSGRLGVLPPLTPHMTR